MRKNKMKKIFGILVVAILVVTIGVVQAASLGLPQAAKKIGNVFTAGDLTYEVTSSSPAEVAVNGLSNTSLTDITIPKEVANVGETYSVTSIGFRAFHQSAIESIVIPQSVTTIAMEAFEGCNALTTVTIANTDDLPSKLVTIGERAFYQSAIESIVIPQNVVTISRRAFAYCKNLTDVTIKNEVGAASQLTTIDVSAFAWSGLTLIIIPQNVEKIGEYAFMNCRTLADITIKNEVGATSRLQTIDQYAFENTALQSIVIPQSVKKIGEYAFNSSKLLTDVTIKNEEGAVSRLTTIEGDAFNTTGLTSIVLPQSVTSIGRRAFMSCKALTTVTITNTEKSPSQLGTIGESAFAFSGLESITIPQNVTAIDKSAFQQCSNFSVLVFSNATSVPTFGTTLFQYARKDITIYVPFVQKAAYAPAIKAPAVLEGYAKDLTVSGYGELVLPERVLTNAEIGTDGYSQSIAAAGGVEGEVTHEITVGALPEGLSMDASGNITGTATKIETATFTVTATVANALANLNYSAKKEYTIDVKDTIAPELSVKSEEVTIEINGVTTEATFVELVDISTKDNSKSVVTITTDFDTVAQNAVGEKAVTITATDESNNVSTKIVTVKVTDTIAPELSVKSEEVTIEINGATTEATFVELVDISANDNSKGVVTIATDFDTVAQNAVGEKAVTITATDESNNVSTKTVTVKVTDTIAPELTVKNEEVTIELGGNVSEADFLSLVDISTDDNSKGVVTITTDFDKVVQNAVGEKVVTITATDESGNFFTTMVTVKVVDTTPEPTTVAEETTTEVVTMNESGIVETGDTFTTPIFFIVALFSVMFILTSRKKEEFQG